MVRSASDLTRQCGRRAQQSALWRANAEAIAQKLFGLLDFDTLEETGALYPRKCDLRKHRNRRLFGFLKQYTGRVFTFRLRLLVIKKLLKMLPFELARGPKETRHDFMVKQADRLRFLATKSKRMARNIDNVETLPLEACLYHPRPYFDFRYSILYLLKNSVFQLRVESEFIQPSCTPFAGVRRSRACRGHISHCLFTAGLS